MTVPPPSKKVTVAAIPTCDFCPAPAMYDSPVKIGARITWAYTCASDYGVLAAPNAPTLGCTLVKD